MFEWYTEKARRVVFFARYEASQYGAHEIDTEHLFLGLLREAKHLLAWAPGLSADEFRGRIDSHSLHLTPIPTSIDLPLSTSCSGALKQAAEEAGRLGHKHIGTEHLFLGVLAVENCLAAQLLREAGADPTVIRHKISGTEIPETAFPDGRVRQQRPVPDAFLEIHGIKRKVDRTRDVVSTLRLYNWHWHKREWKPQDIVVNRKTGQVSFDMSLKEEFDNFTLVQNGWKKDHCFLCSWALFDSDDEHGTGYTNGRIWLCIECCERFILKDYFASSHSDIT